MTQPNEAVDQQQGEQQQQPEQRQVDPKVKEYFESDPRERIWKKFDQMQKEEAERQAPKQEEPEPAPEPEKEPEQAAEPVPEAASTSQEDAPDEEILTREEYEKRFARIKVKGKFAGEETVVPASELVKITGLEKHYQKRLTEVNQREKELLEKQFQVPDPLMAAAYPQRPEVPLTAPAPIGTAVEHLSDAQVRDRYNELALESPFDATRFLEQVREARQQASLRLHQNKANLAQRSFLATHSLSEESQEWQRINSREFYEKYPDILRARDRGDYDSMFATAYLHLQREQFDREREEYEKRITADKTKNEDKKKGQILRASTKPEPVKPKEPPRAETPEEYIARRQREARERQRIKLPPRKT